MALVEVEKCSDINCQYAEVQDYCLEDWFDDDCYGECYHPKAPKHNSLGDNRDKDFLKIPDWCPRRVDKV